MEIKEEPEIEEAMSLGARIGDNDPTNLWNTLLSSKRKFGFIDSTQSATKRIKQEPGNEDSGFLPAYIHDARPPTTLSDASSSIKREPSVANSGQHSKSIQPTASYGHNQYAPAVDDRQIKPDPASTFPSSGVGFNHPQVPDYIRNVSNSYSFHSLELCRQP